MLDASTGAGAFPAPGTAQGTIPMPRGLLGTRRAFASREQGELECGKSGMCQAGHGRGNWDAGIGNRRVWTVLRNWERLRSGISLGGSAGMGWTVWKYLEKRLGKGIVRKISFGGSGMNHLERRGEDKRLDRDKGNSSGEFSRASGFPTGCLCSWKRDLRSHSVRKMGFYPQNPIDFYSSISWVHRRKFLLFAL